MAGGNGSGNGGGVSLGQVPGGKYPHREFKQAAHDSKGHVERLQIRVPPQMLGMLQKAVVSKLWPYDNYQELVRHAVTRHLEWLYKEEPDCGNLTTQIDMITKTLYDEEMHQIIQATYDKMKVVWARNRKIGGDQGAARNLKLAQEMWGLIKDIDDVFWRTLWEKKFRGELEEAFEMAPGVELVEMEEGEEEA